MQLHQPPILAARDALDGHYVVASFAPLPRLQQWLPWWERHFLRPSYATQGLALPPDILARTTFVSDPALVAYHAFGLGRNAALRVYGPRILWQYARWMLQGKPLARPAEDPLQRGGDWVIGGDGCIVWGHSGRDQSDRPTPTTMMQMLERSGR